MNFLKPVDRFLVTQVFQPITQKSSWSQFTWSNMSTFIWNVSAIIFVNKEYIKGNSDKINVFSSILILSTAVWVMYDTNKNKKAGIFKSERGRIYSLYPSVLMLIFFIDSIEIFFLVYGMISTIYFQADMSNPFNEEIEE